MDIRFAGLVFHIENQDPRLEKICGGFVLSEKEIRRVDKKDVILLPSFPQKNRRHPYFPENIPPFQQELNELIFEMGEALEQHGGMILHAAAIEADGLGYLFTAPSGTGKSTHISYWNAYLESIGKTSAVICGDKPAVRKIGGTWMVCGTPWKGKEGWGCDKGFPIQGLCLLERGENNHIEACSAMDMLSKLLLATYYPETEEQMQRHLDLLDDFLTDIRCYRLTCNMTLEAARTAWEGMKPQV